jgi:hypothetical protein
MALMQTPGAISALERDLRAVFGGRLQSLVVYGLRASGAAGEARGHGHETGDGHGPERKLTRTLAVVDGLSQDDLRKCAGRVDSWHDAGLDTPLLVAAHEFARALDVFTFEFGSILADHVVAYGSDPFLGLRVEAADLRRACEVEARGHLLHLREGYLETRGRGDALSMLIVQSAPAFAALVTSVAHLDGVDAARADVAARHVEHRVSLPAAASAIVALAGASEISSAEAERLFGPYLETVARLVGYIDTWKS